MQGLLADWQSLSQQVGSLSDQAAARFDDQLQASQNMAALVASTMGTIADATALAQRLQESYVQQTLMQAASDEVVWSCNRTSKLVAEFSISGCVYASNCLSGVQRPQSLAVEMHVTLGMQSFAAAATTMFGAGLPYSAACFIFCILCCACRSLGDDDAHISNRSIGDSSSTSSQRRRLLARLAGSTSSISRSDKAAAAQLATWAGYWLPTHSKLVADDPAAPGADTPGRFIGAAPGRNKLVGGLLLHTTRKQFKETCTGER
jgi:hypothetical protein